MTTTLDTALADLDRSEAADRAAALAEYSTILRRCDSAKPSDAARVRELADVLGLTADNLAGDIAAARELAEARTRAASFAPTPQQDQADRTAVEAILAELKSVRDRERQLLADFEAITGRKANADHWRGEASAMEARMLTRAPRVLGVLPETPRPCGVLVS